jgi:hypothetical protein
MADMITIFDLEHPTGAAEIYTHTVKAEEMLARDPQRYVRHLPEGVTPGPHVGVDARRDGKTGRIVLL